eukprot:gene966-1874_t
MDIHCYNRSNFRPKLLETIINDVIDPEETMIENDVSSDSTDRHDTVEDTLIPCFSGNLEKLEESVVSDSTSCEVVEKGSPDDYDYGVITATVVHEIENRIEPNEAMFRNAIRQLLSEESVQWTLKSWRINLVDLLNVDRIEDDFWRIVKNAVIEEAEIWKTQNSSGLTNESDSMLAQVVISPESSNSSIDNSISITTLREEDDSSDSESKSLNVLKDEDKDANIADSDDDNDEEVMTVAVDNDNYNDNGGKENVINEELEVIRAVESGPSIRARKILEITGRDEEKIELLKSKLQSQFLLKMKKRLEPKLMQIRHEAVSERRKVKKLLREKGLDEFVEGDISGDDNDKEVEEDLDKEMTSKPTMADVELSGSEDEEEEIEVVGSGTGDGVLEQPLPLPLSLSLETQEQCKESLSLSLSLSPTNGPSSQGVSRRSVIISGGGLQRRQLRASLMTSACDRGAARRAEKLLGRRNCANELLLVLKYNQLQSRKKGIEEADELKKKAEAEISRAEEIRRKYREAQNDDEEEFDENQNQLWTKGLNVGHDNNDNDNSDSDSDGDEYEEEEEEEEESCSENDNDNDDNEDTENVNVNVNDGNDKDIITTEKENGVAAMSTSSDDIVVKGQSVSVSVRNDVAPQGEGEGDPDSSERCDVGEVEGDTQPVTTVDKEEDNDDDEEDEGDNEEQTQPVEEKNKKTVAVAVAVEEEEVVAVQQPPKDRNIEYRRMLLEEERRARRNKRVVGSLLDEEAEEEEELGLQGGLGDFGFGIPSLRNEDDEAAALQLRRSDLEGIVDDLSDGEGDEVEAQRERMKLEASRDAQQTRDVVQALRDGDMSRSRRKDKKGHFDRRELARDDEDEDQQLSKGDRGDEAGNGEEEEDLEEMLLKGLKERFVDNKAVLRKRLRGSDEEDDDSSDGENDGEMDGDGDGEYTVETGEEGLKNLLMRAEQERTADGLLDPVLVQQIEEARSRLDDIRSRAAAKIKRREERKEERNRYKQFCRQADMRRILKRASLSQTHSEDTNISTSHLMYPIESQLGYQTLPPDNVPPPPQQPSLLQRSVSLPMDRLPYKETSGMDSSSTTTHHPQPPLKRRTSVLPSRAVSSFNTPAACGKRKVGGAVSHATTTKPDKVVHHIHGTPGTGLNPGGSQGQSRQRFDGALGEAELNVCRGGGLSLAVDECRKKRKSAAELLGICSQSNKTPAPLPSKDRKGTGLFSAVMTGSSLSSGMFKSGPDDLHHKSSFGKGRTTGRDGIHEESSNTGTGAGRMSCGTASQAPWDSFGDSTILASSLSGFPDASCRSSHGSRPSVFGGGRRKGGGAVGGGVGVGSTMSMKIVESLKLPR